MGMLRRNSGDLPSRAFFQSDTCEWLGRIEEGTAPIMKFTSPDVAVKENKEIHPA
jgi:hypothetical protein